MQRKVLLGTREVDFPSAYLQQLEPCNHLLDDIPALRKEMDSKGYLYIQSLHCRDDVLAARKSILEYIASLGEKLDPQHPIEAGVVRDGCALGCLPFMEGRNDVSHSKEVLAVIEGQRPFDFFKTYFGRDVKTFDYKWLRAMHREGFTGAHVDNVYMSRGSSSLLTMWTPLGDVSLEMGVLAVCEASNRLPSFEKFHDTYGQTDLEAINVKGTGWFTNDPLEISQKFGGQWKTTDFKAGDVIIFNMRTVHMSTANMTHFARLSCDTRWQPADDALDPRFNGNFEKPEVQFGLNSKLENTNGQEEETTVTMETLKTSWGF